MTTAEILTRIQQAPLVFDGAMGTMLYQRGVFLNKCFDEICLSNPGLIAEVHRSYVKAGADVITSNSFGANRIKLAEFGLAERCVDICQEAVRLARQEVGVEGLVAASVGPCLRPGQYLGPDNSAEVLVAFTESIRALYEAGADLILLETFSDWGEAQLALQAAEGLDIAVMLSFAYDESGETARGSSIEQITTQMDAHPGVSIVGMNCGSGPAALTDLLKRVMACTSKPVVVMPNAGSPRQVEGRMLYLTSPEYFTSYAKRMVQMGARGVGGCCGTTPEHIAEMSRAVKAVSTVRRAAVVKPIEQKSPDVQPLGMAQKSRMGAKLSRGERVSSVEILPPKSSDLRSMLQKAQTCYLAGVDAINIPDGPRASARISPMMAAVAIKQQVGIEPVLHYCCRDRNLIGMQSDLLGGFSAGLTNFLLITGDPPKLGDYPDVTGVFDVDAIGLAQLASNLNAGVDLGGNPLVPPTGILIGVGLNPCAVELGRELDRFRRKIDAGAEYAITQPVFDSEALLRIIEQIRTFSDIPIVAGVWPFTSFKNAEFMCNEVPGVVVPDELMERMRHCHTKQEGAETGIEIAREMCRQIGDVVAGFQVSAPFGNVNTAIKVLQG